MERDMKKILQEQSPGEDVQQSRNILVSGNYSLPTRSVQLCYIICQWW